MNRFFRKIHLWLSLPFGLVIAVVCFSGAMLVFENDVMQLARRDLYRVERTATERLPVGTLAAQVAAALPDSVAVTGVTIYADPLRTCEVSLSRPRRASLFADPYTGAIKGRSERAPFFACMFRLHRWLSDNMRPEGGVFVGKLVVGISTLAFVIVLVSGIAVWWPRTRKTLRHTLKIDVRKGWKKFWHDLHVAGGMYALVFLLAMALTGLTWSFAWYRAGFYKLFGAESHQQSRHEPAAASSVRTNGVQHGDRALSPDRDLPLRTADADRQTPNGLSRDKGIGTASFAHWQQVYETLASDNPTYRKITLGDGTASVSFDRPGNRRAADRYRFDPLTGEITEAMPYRNTDRDSKLRGWIYSVHVGSWGGLFTRILAFAAAMLGATLPMTGYYLWMRRKYDKWKRARAGRRQ